MAPGVVAAGGVDKPEQLRTAAEGVLRMVRARRASVCLAISSQWIDARELRLPPMPEDELRAAIHFELRQFFGSDEGDQRLLDFAVLPGRETRSLAPAGQRSNEVLAVSVPRKAMDQYLAPLRAAGVFPDIVDVGAFSLPWAVPRGGGVGYLHMGPRMTNFLVTQNGVYDVSRQTELNLTPLLEAAPGVGVQAAEAWQWAEEAQPAAAGVRHAPALRMATASAPSYPTQNGHRADAGVDASLDALARWLGETLEFARMRRGAVAASDIVQAIVLSGPVAVVPGLASFIQQRIGIPVVPAEPVGFAAGDPWPADTAPAYALAAAMAHRGLTEL